MYQHYDNKGILVDNLVKTTNLIHSPSLVPNDSNECTYAFILSMLSLPLFNTFIYSVTENILLIVHNYQILFNFFSVDFAPCLVWITQ